MTATLSGAPLSDVRLTVPRYGWPTAWVTLSTTDAAAVSEAPGALVLEVAGLAQVCTCIRQGTRAEQRTVELVGGYGGWRLPPPPAGFRAGNLVSLRAYADALALACGERVTLASGVDRKLGAVVARLGELSAGSLLSQACALPAGSAVVPWWVGLDGGTVLGPRTGGAVTYQAADSDPFGRRVQFAEDDARPLLPGGTVGGLTIEELRIEGGGSGVSETVTLAAPGEEPRTFAGGLRRFILAIIGPHVSARTLYRYVVREVYTDGRLRAVPVRAVLAPDLDGLRVWPGIAGGRCRPKVNSEILLQFADGDPVADAACVVGFTPALVDGIGIPDQLELDGDQVVLARGTLPVGRGGAALSVSGTAMLTLTVYDPEGDVHSFDITGSNSGGPVAFVVSPSPSVVLAGGIAVIDEGRAEVLV